MSFVVPKMNGLSRLVSSTFLKGQCLTLNGRLFSTKVDDEIVLTNRKGILTIKINRPNKKNAMTIPMYNRVMTAFSEAATNKDVKMVLLTATGDYYSSGNDLVSGFGSGILKSLRAQLEQKDGKGEIKLTEESKKLADESANMAEQFVNSFIDFPKPLFAIVNGPAFGSMVTTLALCDNVICSDKAIFSTPFLATSQVPEACSSFTFPRIMGTARANSMLLFNQPLTAQEALYSGFVSKIIPHNELEKFIETTFYDEKKGLASFESTVTWSKGKPLMRTEREREQLRQVNHAECQALAEIWGSADFAQAMIKFFTRKK